MLRVLAGSLLAISSATAAAAAIPPVPELSQVEGLCPGVAGNPLVFGTVEAEVTEAALAETRTRAVAAGFEEIEPVYTSWSQRLVGVDYVIDVPGGEPLDSWSEEFAAAVGAGGWEVTEDGSMIIAAARYFKQFPATAGVRDLTLDVDLYGERSGITLRCSDAALNFEAADERNGMLPVGSPRPLAPPPMPPLDEFLARLDCQDPALLEKFAAAENLGDTGALVEASLGPPDGLNAEADYYRRLRIWTRWKLLASERMDQEDIWDVEEKVSAANPTDHMAELVGMMGAIGGVMEAQKAGDMPAVCASYREAIVAMSKQNALDVERDQTLIAAFEAEAKRRGISLD